MRIPIRNTSVRLAFVAVAATVAATLPAAASTVCASAAPAPLTFSAPAYIDKNAAGGEPVSVVAQDGSIIVSSHAGTTHLFKDVNAAPGAGDFVVGYTNQTINWRSPDGGTTWKRIGLAGTSAGPHTLTSTGYSDPDLTMDQSGRIYNTEIDLANIAVYSSTDQGQSFLTGNPMVTPGDRPWLTGQDPDEVFLALNAFIERQLWRSTDGGLTFSLINENLPTNGKNISDPLNPHHGLIGPVGTDGIAISADDGLSWTEYYGADLGAATQFFGTVGADAAGNIYMAAAGGYGGPNDVDPNGEVTFNSFNRLTEQWGVPVVISTPPGDALWPWIVAGDDGRVAVAWYQNDANDPRKFSIYAAYTTNGHGSTVPCSDGSTRFVYPQFSVANASGRPVHNGQICLQGTLCNTVTGSRGDRRLGDFLTINFDLNGRLFIASGDTMLRSPTSGPKPVSNPIFIQQSGGDPLLATPITPLKPRCKFLDPDPCWLP